MGNKNGPVIPKKNPIDNEIQLSKGYASIKNKRKRKRKDDPEPLAKVKIIKKNNDKNKNKDKAFMLEKKKKDIFDEIAKPENIDAYIALLNILLTQN